MLNNCKNVFSKKKIYTYSISSVINAQTFLFSTIWITNCKAWANVVYYHFKFAPT